MVKTTKNNMRGKWKRGSSWRTAFLLAKLRRRRIEAMIQRVIAVPMTNACAEERFTLVLLEVVLELVRAVPA